MKYVSGRVKELKVGISSYSESKTTLITVGNVNVSGSVTATTFFGDGSSLTGIAATDNVRTNSLVVSGVSTFNGAIDANGDLDVDGHTELDNLNVSGVSTFAGIIDSNGQIVGAATSNIIPFLYSNYSLFPSATTYHGAVAHAHNTGKLYYAHGGNWIELVSQETTGTVGTGTERYNIGPVDLTTLDVSGISTFAGNINANGNIVGDNSTNISGIASVTATSFHGDGSNLTGIDATALKDTNDTIRVQANTSGAVVTGILTATTFKGDVDAVNIDVDGRADIDDLIVTGVSTFSGAIDSNAGANIAGGLVANSAQISDLTNGRVVYAGASGELQDSSNLTFDGTTLSGTFSGDGTALSVSIPGISTGGTSEFSNLNLSGIVTAAGAVFGTAKVSDLTDNRVVVAGTGGELEDSTKFTFDGSTLAIVGDATFTGNVTIGGTLTSEDKTNVDSIGIVTARTGVRISSGGLVVSSGVATFTDAIDANGGANISGGSGLVAATAKISDLTSGRVVVAGTAGELEDSGSFTFSGGTVTATAFAGDGSGLTGITAGGVGAIGGLTVKDEGVVVGTAGSVSTIDFRGGLVSVIATAGAAGVATATIVSESNPTLALLNVTGVSTFQSAVGISSDLTLSSTDTGSSAGPILNLYRNSATPADADYLGQIKFQGESDTGVQRNYAKITGKILDASNTSEDGIIEFAHIKAGSQTITARFRSDSLQLLNSTNFSVDGTSTFTGDITANGNIAGDGATNISGMNDVTASNFNSTSDAKLKTNVETITSPLEKLNQIDGVSFNWISDNKPSMGVIADTVEKVLPELVTSDDPKTVNYNGLIGLLIEAVKEQQVQITELKSKLDSLS